MATIGFLFIGMIVGMVFAVLLLTFLVLRSDAGIRDTLREGAIVFAARLSGRPVRAETAQLRSPEQEQRVRSLQEEVRVMQRLLDQEKAALAAGTEELARSVASAEELRAKLADSRSETAAAQAEIAAQAADTDRMRNELADSTVRQAEMVQEIRDLRTELDVARAGDSFIHEQVLHLQTEKEDLARRVEQMANAKPGQGNS